MTFVDDAVDVAAGYGTEIYVGTVLALGAWTLVRVLRGLRTTETSRRRRLRARKRMNAVKTESPLENSLDSAQQRGIDSIVRYSTVIRRLLVPVIVLATGALAALPLLSRVPATMVSLVVAIATVVLGVAARPLIENAMSGLVIAFSRLVNIGDTVKIEGQYGTIEDISATHTTVKLWDWRRFVVPNSKMLQQSFLNYSVHDKYEWTYVSFSVSYEASIELVREIALSVPERSTHFADHESPQFWVMELGPHGYEIWLAAWANTPSEAWELRTDMREALILEFQANDIPMQQMRHEISHAPEQPPRTATSDE